MNLLDSETCEATLFKRYAETKCEKSPFLLHEETFILVSNGYIIVPVEPMKLDINCETFLKYETVSKPSLLQGHD